MHNTGQFVIFFSIMLAVFFGMHYYVFIRLADGFALAGHVRMLVRMVFLSGGLLFFLSEYLTHRPTPPAIHPLMLLGASWIGLLSISLAVTVLADMFRLAFRTPQAHWIITVSSLAAMVVLGIFSYLHASGQPAVHKFTLHNSKMPPDTSMTIVQLTDIHLDSLKDPAWFAAIANTVNKQNPDVILITGDLIDADSRTISPFFPALRSLKATHGVYAITGNHEYYHNVDSFLNDCRQCGIVPVRNEHASVNNLLDLAGIDDIAFTGREGVGPALQHALGPCDQKKFIVLMSHQPDVFDRAAALGADLQLSGHTHRGQIPPMDILVHWFFKYPYGLYKRGAAYLYTSPGTGTWGPPMRLTSTSEITVFNVTR